MATQRKNGSKAATARTVTNGTNGHNANGHSAAHAMPGQHEATAGPASPAPTPNDEVLRLRGSVQIEYTLARTRRRAPLGT